MTASEPARPRSALLRRWVRWAMLALLLVSLAAWLVTRDRLPPRVRIATAAPGGLYNRLGTVLAPRLSERLRRPVDVVATAGSEENLGVLERGGAELALLQGELAGSPGIVVLTPVMRDLVCVVVRSEAGIETLADLEGRAVALGLPGSGMRRTAETVLAHYGIGPGALRERDRYFGDLADDAALDAAVVTTGLLNPDLGRLLASGRFHLLPVADSEALAVRNPLLEPAWIPRGFFRERPPVPAERLATVSTMTVLAAREGAPAALVQAALSALYDGYVRREVPTLVERAEASAWSELPLHPAALSWFQPFSGLGILADLMESLAALKELLVAFGAALYLAFGQWQRLKERERQAARNRDKERLDRLFEETMRIERLQMEADDPQVLRGQLDEVTSLKLHALEELTHEDLRGDVAFSIFLQQCANLIRKIQSKVEYLASGGRYPRAPASPGNPGEGSGQEPRPE